MFRGKHTPAGVVVRACAMHGQGLREATAIPPTSRHCHSRSGSASWSIARPPRATRSVSPQRLKFAGLRQNTVLEDVDLRTPRGIDRALFQKLVDGDWIDRIHPA